MKLSKRLIFCFALLAFGLVPPEKGPNGIAPPADARAAQELILGSHDILLKLRGNLTNKERCQPWQMKTSEEDSKLKDLTKQAILWINH